MPPNRVNRSKVPMLTELKLQKYFTQSIATEAEPGISIKDVFTIPSSPASYGMKRTKNVQLAIVMVALISTEIIWIITKTMAPVPLHTLTLDGTKLCQNRLIGWIQNLELNQVTGLV